MSQNLSSTTVLIGLINQGKEGTFSHDMAGVCVNSPVVELGKEMAASNSLIRQSVCNINQQDK